jgi:hypothetical protein
MMINEHTCLGIGFGLMAFRRGLGITHFGGHGEHDRASFGKSCKAPKHG